MTTLKQHPEWDSYIETFVKYFVRRHFHVRRGYAEGFKREKTDKFANVPINEENIEQIVAKHLDLITWNDQHPDDQEEFFWLAQYGPVKTRLDCIDYDNKGNIVGKELIVDDRGRRQPVVNYPLSQLQVLKRLYDLFPGRIWCISSETLGFHIWSRVGALELLHVRQERVQRRLAKLGMEKTEVHPMSGWPQRRPFGEHYRTITANGVLTDWRTQTRHFLNPGPVPVPSFQQIYDEIRSSLLRQWDQFDGKPDVLEQCCEQLDETDTWMNAGCPLEEISVPVTGSSQKKSSVKNGPQPFLQNDKPDFCKTSINNEKPSLANLLKWSICGLLEDDSVFPVCREITYWLFIVELSCKDKKSRCQQIYELLHDFIALKHNGFSSRVNQSEQEDVYSQIDRIVSFVSKDKLNRKQHFVSLKQDIDNGKYKYPISIVPLLTKSFSDDFKSKAIASLESSPPSFTFLKQLLTSTSSNNSLPLPLRYDYSCISTYEENCSCPLLEEMLEEYFINGPDQSWRDIDNPSEVMRQMIEERELLEKPLNHKMRKDKQKKVTEFAKCVVAKLAANGGADSLGHEWCFKVFGYKNPTRATEFLQHLMAAAVIIQVHVAVPGVKSAGYQLSLPPMDTVAINGEALTAAVL